MTKTMKAVWVGAAVLALPTAALAWNAGQPHTDSDGDTWSYCSTKNPIYSEKINGKTHYWVLDKCFKGTPGPAGPAGPQGPRGTTGATGPQGPKGATGPQGPKGATGPQGPKGDTGLRGTSGADGAPGIRGERGLDGVPGVSGTSVQLTPQRIAKLLPPFIVSGNRCRYVPTKTRVFTVCTPLKAKPSVPKVAG